MQAGSNVSGREPKCEAGGEEEGGGANKNDEPVSNTST